MILSALPWSRSVEFFIVGVGRTVSTDSALLLLPLRQQPRTVDTVTGFHGGLFRMATRGASTGGHRHRLDPLRLPGQRRPRPVQREGFRG